MFPMSPVDQKNIQQGITKSNGSASEVTIIGSNINACGRTQLISCTWEAINFDRTLSKERHYLSKSIGMIYSIYVKKR